MAKTEKTKDPTKPDPEDSGPEGMAAPAFPPIGEDEDDGEDDGDDQLKALNDRIAGLETANQEAAKREERLLKQLQQLAFRQQPGTGQPQPQPQPEPETNYDGLPDPVTDAAGYGRELAKRIAAGQKQAQPAPAAQTNTGDDDDGLNAMLWDKLNKAHPELKPVEDFVLAEGVRQVRTLQQQGIDVRAYLRVNADEFVETVAMTVQERMRAFAGGAETGTENEGGQQQQQQRTNRTAGMIPAAGPNGAAAVPSKGKTKPSTLVDEIKEDQLRGTSGERFF